MNSGTWRRLDFHSVSAGSTHRGGPTSALPPCPSTKYCICTTLSPVEAFSASELAITREHLVSATRHVSRDMHYHLTITYSTLRHALARLQRCAEAVVQDSLCRNRLPLEHLGWSWLIVLATYCRSYELDGCSPLCSRIAGWVAGHSTFNRSVRWWRPPVHLSVSVARLESFCQDEAHVQVARGTPATTHSVEKHCINIVSWAAPTRAHSRSLAITKTRLSDTGPARAPRTSFARPRRTAPSSRQ